MRFSFSTVSFSTLRRLLHLLQLEDTHCYNLYLWRALGTQKIVGIPNAGPKQVCWTIMLPLGLLQVMDVGEECFPCWHWTSPYRTIRNGGYFSQTVLTGRACCVDYFYRQRIFYKSEAIKSGKAKNRYGTIRNRGPFPQIKNADLTASGGHDACHGLGPKFWVVSSRYCAILAK